MRFFKPFAKAGARVLERRKQGAKEGASIRAKARLVAGLCLGVGDSQSLDCAQGVREGAKALNAEVCGVCLSELIRQMSGCELMVLSEG